MKPFLLLFAFAALLSEPPQAAAAAKPNILFILADDMG